MNLGLIVYKEGVLRGRGILVFFRLESIKV